MTEPRFVPLETWRELPVDEMRRRARAFAENVSRRRTIREFSSRDVPAEVIDDCLAAAGTAPSGANMQPWHFVVVRDPAVKARIRVAAEEEEREFYEHRASPEWLAALEPLGTDATGSRSSRRRRYLIADVPAASTRCGSTDGRKVKHYYPTESTGLATGILDHGAAPTPAWPRLTHTPSPMKFPERDPRPAGQREAVPPARGGLPGRRGASARHRAQAARRHPHDRLSAATRHPSPVTPRPASGTRHPA